MKAVKMEGRSAFPSPFFSFCHSSSSRSRLSVESTAHRRRGMMKHADDCSRSYLTLISHGGILDGSANIRSLLSISSFHISRLATRCLIAMESLSDCKIEDRNKRGLCTEELNISLSTDQKKDCKKLSRPLRVVASAGFELGHRKEKFIQQRTGYTRTAERTLREKFTIRSKVNGY